MPRSGAPAFLLILATVGCSQSAVARRPLVDTVAPLGSPAAASTSRESLERTRIEMEARLKSEPHDTASAVRLADALLRLARVTNNSGFPIRAERALVSVLDADPDRYDARRMLATALLSQHRFRDAIREAERCRQMQPRDAWPLGVIGDSHLELGEYDLAFDAFQRMVDLRPDAASYARASYAREIQGDLPDALRLMRMALEATSPNDPESLAWHHVQIGGLQLALHNTSEAAREYQHAAVIFPGHPMPAEGLARVDAARGNINAAIARLEALARESASPSIVLSLAEYLRKAGREQDAIRYARLAEATWDAETLKRNHVKDFAARMTR